MKYCIKTPYHCLVKTQSQMFELDSQDSLECENEDNLIVYPIGQKIPSFCISLNSEKSQFYSFFSHNEKKYIILEKMNDFLIKNKEKFNFSGKFCYLTIGNNFIKFETDSKEIEISCSHSCNEYNLHKLKNFACIEFEKDFYAFSIIENKIYHFSGTKISFDDNKLTVTKKYNDSNLREKVSTYNFSQDITLESENFVSNQNCDFDEILPFKFLEGVKAKDYSSILHFLSQNLREKIDETKLQKFFGNVNEIMPLSINEFILTTNSTKKFVTFSLQNKKITDISIDDL